MTNKVTPAPLHRPPLPHLSELWQHCTGCDRRSMCGQGSSAISSLSLKYPECGLKWPKKWSDHVSHVCGYAKKSRFSPVARSSLSTNLRRGLAVCRKPAFIWWIDFVLCASDGSVKVPFFRIPWCPGWGAMTGCLVVDGGSIRYDIIQNALNALVCAFQLRHPAPPLVNGSILVARQKFFRCLSKSGSSTRDLRKAIESSAKCPSLR
eukprot:6184618-Pleurochrysis_carterae.AAC.1